MDETLVTSLISTITTLVTVIIPLIASASGRNALRVDMDLYRQWGNTLYEVKAKSNSDAGNEPSITAAQNDTGQSVESLGSSSNTQAVEPDEIKNADENGKNMHDAKSDKDVGLDDLVDIDEKALISFRRSIDMKLMLRARNGGRSVYIYGAILIVMLAIYIFLQLTTNVSGLVDDLVRSFVYIALVLIVIGVFTLTNVRAVNRGLMEIGEIKF